MFHTVFHTILPFLEICTFPFYLFSACTQMYPVCLYVSCADDGIGKCDLSALSQQSLMELFIFGLDRVDDICGSRENPRELRQWQGLAFNADGEVVSFYLGLDVELYTGTTALQFLPSSVKELNMSSNKLTRRKDTSPWWVGPVPQFLGKPRTFSNPSSCFCHGADPIDGHRKVVGQDQYPALGEVRETAKLFPRGESPWWRDEGRHLLILCLFSIRGMRLAHMNNAKSREHAHTCRKARAILRY
ncbi:hypothetical protein XU18_2042 [Perkinsela sp. CCAP 1560/4]|nr:hypothetical protein XU18_2042 [Perkinsela sp. CCAP 1560/4]|eukprot:KNH07510.1 hypothetical protein XU18_2042 [Perkinsela sp. CCAP 1560/4]